MKGMGWIAAVDLDLNISKPGRSMGQLPRLLFSDILLIIGVGLGLVAILALGIYLWMKFRRNRRRRVSGGEKVYRGTSQEPDETDHTEVEAEDEDSNDGDHRQNRRRYKYRVRRRTHRSRNPTLSETGGLPPARPQEPTKPC